jgi:hypothetical protein
MSSDFLVRIAPFIECYIIEKKEKHLFTSNDVTPEFRIRRSLQFLSIQSYLIISSLEQGDIRRRGAIIS